MDKSGKSLQEVCAQDATVPTQLMKSSRSNYASRLTGDEQEKRSGFRSQ